MVGDAGAGGVRSLCDDERSAESADAVPAPLLDAGEVASVFVVGVAGSAAGDCNGGGGLRMWFGAMLGANRWAVGVVGVVVADVDADVDGVVGVVGVGAVLGRRKLGIWLRDCGGCEFD